MDEAQQLAATTATELGHHTAHLGEIERLLRLLVGRPAFDRVWTVLNTDGDNHQAATIKLGRPGRFLVRAWATHRNIMQDDATSVASDAGTWLFQGDYTEVQCASRFPRDEESTVIDGLYCVPSGGVAEFICEGADALTVYFDNGCIGNQGVTVRVTLLDA